MNQYHCEWRIDVEGENPIDAARFAEQVALDNNSRKWVVFDADGTETVVDLDDLD